MAPTATLSAAQAERVREHHAARFLQAQELLAQRFIDRYSQLLDQRLALLARGHTEIPPAMTAALGRLIQQYLIEVAAQMIQATDEEVAVLAGHRQRNYIAPARSPDDLQALGTALGAHGQALAAQEDADLTQQALEIIRQGQDVPSALQQLKQTWENARLPNIATTEGIKVGNAAKLGVLGTTPGVDYVRFRAIIDKRTTATCRSRHGKVLKLTDKRLGSNCPPLHHRCRSLLMPVMAYEEVSADDLAWPEMLDADGKDLLRPADGFGGVFRNPPRGRQPAPSAGPPGIASSLEDLNDNPHKALPPPLSAQQMAQEALNIYDACPPGMKGATVNRYFGNMIGQDYWMVGMRHHSDYFDGPPTLTNMTEYIKRKAKHIRDPQYNFGLWYSERSNRTYLDTSLAVVDEEKAKRLGILENQEAIANTKSGRLLDLGGSGN